MRTRYSVEDMTIDRIVEKEYPFERIRQFLPSLDSYFNPRSRSFD